MKTLRDKFCCFEISHDSGLLFISSPCHLHLLPGCPRPQFRVVIVIVNLLDARAGNEPSRSLKFHNHGEGPYLGPLLDERAHSVLMS